MREIRRVSRAPSPDVPPLIVGDACRLNSGGPLMLVVDLGGMTGRDILICSWIGGDGRPVESKFIRATVRRA